LYSIKVKFTIIIRIISGIYLSIQMHLRVLLGTAIATIAMFTGSAIPQSQAVKLQDGTVYFIQPPRLVETATTYNDVGAWSATYYFTVSLPENAAEPLQQITINQHEGVDYIRFDLKNSFAFEGTRSRKGQRVGLKDATSDGRSLRSLREAPPTRSLSVRRRPAFPTEPFGNGDGVPPAGSDRKTQTVSLIFDPPISPGRTITIGLKPWQNPTVEGVYLFGVTAFPAGEKAHSQFLGFGRLQFYRGSSNSLFFR
jgi:Protein of unknown function (DUF2808)